MKVFCVLALAGIVATTSFTADLNIKQCDKSGCKPVQKRIALDATSNSTSSTGEKLIIVGGAGMDELTLKYGDAASGGPRVYLIEEDGVNKNHMFMLKDQEFAFDVELSTMPCGFNAALYFVGMNANQGGAENGTKYCDAQAVGGTFCSEMDVMEANTEAQQYTTHACIDTCGSYTDGVTKCEGTGSPSTVCDQSGCGLNPFRYGPGTTYNDETTNAAWYGPGTAYTLNSKKSYTVVTQFHADPVLSNITRFYLQNGNRIDLPTLFVLPPKDGQHMGGFVKPSISKGFCTEIYDRWNGEAAYAPLEQMGKNMENGMVLAMSAWYAEESYVNGKPQGTQTGMSWLDGVNNWGKYIKAGPCDQSTTDSAGPYQAIFSNIRIGDIGTTTGPVVPTPPTPPMPTPAPATPTPAPGPAPGPAPAGCPGGSLTACIGLCPSSPPIAYKDCVSQCVDRCN
jgi:hypothetical protein